MIQYLTRLILNLMRVFLVITNFNKIYDDFLLTYINNQFDNVKLTRRYLND
jgi:hypothetical protein